MIFSDTVFLITDKDTIEPYIKLKYGKLMPEIKNITDQNKIHLKSITENNNYILINYGYQSSAYTIIWDKRSGTTVSNCKIDYADNNSLINSTYFTDYTTPNGDQIKVGIAGISSDTLYCVVKTDDAVNFMDNMSVEDNPLVLEIKLK